MPAVAVGQGWLTPADSRADTAALARWWQTLGDPELEGLVELALTRNLDLRQAEQNIEASRAMLSRAEALDSPTLKASGSVRGTAPASTARNTTRNAPRPRQFPISASMLVGRSTSSAPCAASANPPPPACS
ncbi:MAG: TolC family protein [Uliginosibacterium sp.]|nr:TolC family protein [Uliginosibacterium sp.]